MAQKLALTTLGVEGDTLLRDIVVAGPMSRWIRRRGSRDQRHAPWSCVSGEEVLVGVLTSTSKIALRCENESYFASAISQNRVGHRSRRGLKQPTHVL